MIVEKAVNMAKMMNIPVLGLVENMSYYTCPDCGKRLYPFGQSKVMQVAQAHSLPVLATLPIDPTIAMACDAGRVEQIAGDWMDGALAVLGGIEARA